MKTSSAKLVGNPSSTCWTQVYEFKPTDTEKLQKRGHLLGVISTKDKDNSSVDLGREIITRLQEEYFGNDTASAFNGLKIAVEKIRSEFSDSSVQIAAVVTIGRVVYSVTSGGSSVAIYRANSVATVLESIDTTVASGYPKKGDVLILLTNEAKKSITPGVLKLALEQGAVGDGVTYLSPSVHSNENACAIGVAFLEFEPGEVKQLRQPMFTKGRTKLAGAIGALLKKLPERGLYVKGGERSLETPKKKTAVLIGGILIILLFVSILFGLKRRTTVEKMGRYQDRLTEAQHNFDESLALFDLNPERARELFSESNQLLEAIINEGIEDKVVNDLKSKLDQESGRILGEYDTLPESFIDLSLLASDFNGEDLSSSEGNLLVLDKTGRKLASIVINSKRTEIVGGPSEIEEPLSVASYSDEAYVLEKSAVYSIDGDALKLFEVNENTLLYAYAANLYTLDKNESKVLRHARVGSEFADAKNWFGAGVEPDLTKIISWAIDGSVWMLSSSGTISKFTLGRGEVFRIEGVNPELVNPTQIYTDEISDIYVLEPEKKRVVVMDKNGQFIAQYKTDELGNARDIAVSTEDKLLIFLTGDKLQSIKLSHL